MDFFYEYSGLILKTVAWISVIFMWKWAIVAKTKLGGLASGLNDKSKGTVQKVSDNVNRGNKIRQQSKDAFRQKQFLDRAVTGKGVRGKMFQARAKLMGGGARGQMQESLFEAQDKLRQQKLSTVSSALGRSGGAVLAADLARMDRGETVSQYEARTKKKFNEPQKQMMEQLHSRFGSQIGSTEFRMGALMAAHAAGSDFVDVQAATKATAEALRTDLGTSFAANNVMIETLGKSAKEGGFGSLAYAGFKSEDARSYDDFAIKGSPAGVKGGVEGATAAATAIDLGSLEGEQIYTIARDPVTGAKTTDPSGRFIYAAQTVFGQGLVAKLKEDPSSSTARLVSALRRDRIKDSTRQELIEVAKAAGIWADVEKSLKRI